jgi:hypothetical protein
MKNALAALALLFVLSGCPRERPAAVPTAAPQLSETRTQPLYPSGDASHGSEVEACVDRWLQERQLDRYGHEEGTMYTGGTPLFDERTGQTTDRVDYVFGRHPEAKAACAPGAPAPERLPER